MNNLNIFHYSFVDNQVVQFLQSILPLLNEEIEIQCFPLHWYKPKNHPVDDLMALLAPKTEKLKFFYGHDFYVLDQFNQLFPNFIYGLRSIYLKLDIHRGWREEDLDLILKWLSEPREDGKSKMLQIDFYYFECYTYHTIIRRIKKVSGKKFLIDHSEIGLTHKTYMRLGWGTLWSGTTHLIKHGRKKMKILTFYGKKPS